MSKTGKYEGLMSWKVVSQPPWTLNAVQIHQQYGLKYATVHTFTTERLDAAYRLVFWAHDCFKHKADTPINAS